jgi:four helix bundle protein
MKYDRFEDLPVWKAAIEFAVLVYALTANKAFRGHRSLRNQLEPAAVSVSNNIAEGFERGTTKELLAFLYIARGSCGESRSMLCLLDKLPDFAHLKSEISDLRSRAESISRQLRAWANSLQNSEIKGQRYLTDKVRQSAQADRQRDEFIEELRRAQNENITRLERSRQEDKKHD